jgi:hypothetical protein
MLLSDNPGDECMSFTELLFKQIWQHLTRLSVVIQSICIKVFDCICVTVSKGQNGEAWGCSGCDE